MVSILYIGLPASGNIEEPGVQSETSVALIPLFSAQPIAYNNSAIPTNENGAAIETESGVPSKKMIPVPNAMQTHAMKAIFEASLPLPIRSSMPVGKGMLVSVLPVVKQCEGSSG